MSQSHADYSLPGLRDADDERILVASIIYAYSRATNERRLESHFYAFWNQVFSALLADIKYAISVPQNTLYAAPVVGKRPKTRVKVSENDNISGVTAIFPKTSKVRHPDFGLVVTSFVQRYSTNDTGACPPTRNYSLWPTVKINYGGPLGFGEVKRPPSRTATSVEDFHKVMETTMRQAQQDLEDDLALVFSNPAYKLKKYVLIACVGEWWTFKIASKSRFLKEKKARKPDVGHLADNFDQGLESEINTTLFDIPDDDITPITNEFRRYEDIPNMAALEENASDVDLKRWSGFILFGTEVSNQSFYVIHQQLERLARKLCLGEMHTEPVASDSDPYDTEDDNEGMKVPEDQPGEDVNQKVDSNEQGNN